VVWRYCADSARYLFGERTGNTTADRILAELKERGPMTRDAMRELFQRHKSSAEIATALETLRTAGLATGSKSPSEGGRPAEVWQAC
jgi:predicted ArsR family transcriptional regulator